jgi:hypothetical protein
MWESNTQPNKAGKTIFETLLNSQNMCLLTPLDLGTRIDTSTGKKTTIGLTITWITNDNSWADWNHHLHTKLQEANFLGTRKTDTAYTALMVGLGHANSACIKNTNATLKTHSEPSRLWWNDESNKLVKKVRKAIKTWCKSLSTELRTK